MPPPAPLPRVGVAGRHTDRGTPPPGHRPGPDNFPRQRPRTVKTKTGRRNEKLPVSVSHVTAAGREAHCAHRAEVVSTRVKTFINTKKKVWFPQLLENILTIYVCPSYPRSRLSKQDRGWGVVVGGARGVRGFQSATALPALPALRAK